MSVEKRDWKKIVSESGGSLVFAPEKFIPIIKEWDEKRLKLNKLANEAAKHELETRMLLENTIVEMRKHLEESGYPDAWLADVGFEVNALKDGEFVITVSEFGKGSR